MSVPPFTEDGNAETTSDAYYSWHIEQVDEYIMQTETYRGSSMRMIHR